MALRRIIPWMICLLLLLSGCCAIGVNPPSTTITVKAGPSSESTPPGLAVNNSSISPPSEALKTEADVQSLYTDLQEMTIKSIKPYKGDFLVAYGLKGGPLWFDWVYGSNRKRVRLMCCAEGIRTLEIQQTGTIRVITNGISCIDDSYTFPYIQSASTLQALDEKGAAIPYSSFYDASLIETYWATVSESSHFGTINRKEAVINASVGASGLELAFGPRGDQTNGISDFTAGSCAPPETEITYDAANRVMTVTCHNTALKSGTLPENMDPALKNDFEQWLSRAGTPFPSDFPAGKLSGQNPLVNSAVISEADGATIVTMQLTEKASEYTVQVGYTGPNDIGPYFRIVLRQKNTP